MKLFIQETGDPTVGLMPIDYAIDCPFDKEADEETRKWFIDSIIETYKEFAETSVVGWYEDEPYYWD